MPKYPQKIVILILFFILGGVKAVSICNGDFQQYGLVHISTGLGISYKYFNSSYDCWYSLDGGQIQIKSQWTPFTTFTAELSHNIPYILCQDVTLQAEKYYQLNFSIFHSSQVYLSTVTVMINTKPLFSHTTLYPYNFTNASFIFRASTDTTQLCFDYLTAVYPHLLNVAPCVDNVTLDEVFVEFNETDLVSNLTNITEDSDSMVVWAVSMFASLPVNLLKIFRCAFLLLDDLWLYYYNNKNYTGLIQVIFQTTTNLQLLKFQYLEKYIGWNKYKSWLRISDYKNFTVDRFVEVEGSSSVLLDSNFTFFIYTAPQNILFCLVLRLLYYLFRSQSIGQSIRKFYFIKVVLARALLEQNLNYFVFVCFSNLNQSFTFSFSDKIALSFTVIFLLGLLLFCLCFYFLIFRYLGKHAVHFAEFTQGKSSAFLYKTSQLLLRNFLRAMVFYFFHYEYTTQLIFLCFIEILMIFTTVTLQGVYNIFLSEINFILNIFYYFLFFLLNICLIFENQYEQDDVLVLLKEIEETIIYFLIGNTILMMILDLLSLRFSKKQKLQLKAKYLGDEMKIQKEIQINKRFLKFLSLNLKKKIKAKRIITKMKKQNSKIDSQKKIKLSNFSKKAQPKRKFIQVQKIREDQQFENQISKQQGLGAAIQVKKMQIKKMQALTLKT